MFASLFPRRGERARTPRPTTRLFLEPLEERQLLNGQIDVLKFRDLNFNGIRDVGEPGIAGVPIQLMRDGVVVETKFTLADDHTTPNVDESGFQWFVNLPHGTYFVIEVVPPGFIPTTSPIVQVEVVDGQPQLAAFGNFGDPSQVDILKFHDINGNGVLNSGEPGVAGVTIQLLREGVVIGTRVTLPDDPNTPNVNEAGFNWFTNVAPGTYLVREIQPPGTAATTPTEVQMTLTAGAIEAAVFGNHRAEGCTPGYWKNNAEKHNAVSWGPTGYSPNQKVSSVFSSVTGALGNQTLLQALNAGGGGVNALLRHAVAAVLNAAHPYVHYALSVTQIVQQVNAAIAGGNATVIEDLKDKLEGFNQLGCPIDQHGRRTDS